MIPPFDESGYLPVGIHPAIFGEIEERFGRGSELRRAQAESLRWLLDLAKDAGADEPNDVDCVVLIGPNFSPETRAARELLDGLPFLDLQLVVESEFTILVDHVFATDRDGIPKGMVEVTL